MTTLRGKVSWFGGPSDTGVSPSEGLAFIYKVDDAPHLFLAEQPPGTTGLARRLDPVEVLHRMPLGLRRSGTSKAELLHIKAMVRAPKTGRAFLAYPGDWGPHEDTGPRRRHLARPHGRTRPSRPTTRSRSHFRSRNGRSVMPYDRVAISSGHGALVRGASGVLDEVDEARRVVEALAEELAAAASMS